MLRFFYRWLYHLRLRRDARNRLSGRARPRQKFWRFGYHVLHRADFDNLDRNRTRRRVVLRVLGVLGVLTLLWVGWQSARVWNIFQG